MLILAAGNFSPRLSQCKNFAHLPHILVHNRASVSRKSRAINEHSDEFNPAILMA
jgi:hypothetical protein